MSQDKNNRSLKRRVFDEAYAKSNLKCNAKCKFYLNFLIPFIIALVLLVLYFHYTLTDYSKMINCCGKSVINICMFSSSFFYIGILSLCIIFFFSRRAAHKRYNKILILKHFEDALDKYDVKTIPQLESYKQIIINQRDYWNNISTLGGIVVSIAAVLTTLEDFDIMGFEIFVLFLILVALTFFNSAYISLIFYEKYINMLDEIIIERQKEEGRISSPMTYVCRKKYSRKLR